MADHSADCGASYIDPDGVPNPKRCDCGADHDGHTINVGAVTVGKTLPPLDDPHPCSCRVCAAAREFNRMRAENTALERKLNAALVDVVNMANQETAAAVANEQALDDMRAENDALAAALGDIADGECMSYDAVCCWELDPADPEEWCSACVAEVAWSAWKMGVLGG